MRHLQVSFFAILLFAIGTGRRLSASDPEPVNEVGIQYLGHVALAVSDVEKALHFYTYQLGLKEAFRLKKPDGSLMLIYLRVNDNNFVELFPASGKQPALKPDQAGFRHLGLFVQDLQATLRALQKRGYALPANAFKEAAQVRADNTLLYFIHDPDGHGVELSQITPDSLQAKSRQK